MKKLKMEKDYWFPSPKYINNRGRKRSIAKIFDIDYEDDLDKYNSGHILWSSTTAQPKKKFIIPIGDIHRTVKLREVRWVKGIIGLFKKSRKNNYFGKHS